MSKLAKALTAAAGNAGGDNLYVEDVFSTYLYTGTEASSQTITNGINLADEGGLVWVKARNSAIDHVLMDTEQGIGKYLNTNNTNAQGTNIEGIKSFNADGFTFGTQTGVGWSNDHVYWTFRKAEKFFDVVTWTGNGSVPRSIPHALGSIPGFVAIKLTSGADNWICRHRSLGDTPNDMTSYTPNNRIFLNLTNAAGGSSNIKADATNLTVNHVGNLNASGQTYVAYLFAHDAGGFGDDGDESIIKCGSFTANGSGNYDGSTDLGFEPQLILYKCSTAVDGGWEILDTMRGWSHGTGALLRPTTSDQEFSTYYPAESAYPVQNGFVFNNAVLYSNQSYVYIAIRRPMKTPESGTEVYEAAFRAAADPAFNSGFPVDMAFFFNLASSTKLMTSRMTGSKYLSTNSTAAENTISTFMWDYQDGWNSSGSSASTVAFSQMFKRATGFFDVVAYTGGGSSVYKYKHNLGVAPELIIIKSRSNGTNVNYWPVKMSSVAGQKPLALNSAAANPLSSTSYWSSFTDTATEFATRASSSAYDVNATGYTYIAYLFASVTGVSKVGSYTGTGANVDVDCGFSSGARFILIKRTDSTGDWYVWDSVRGIVAGNDPYLLLNSTAAQVTSTDYIDPLSSGFTVTSSAPAALNASGGTYIFLAIA